jgi:hypothetical protein
MPDSLIRPLTLMPQDQRESLSRLAGKLRRAADELEKDGLHAIRLLDAHAIALAALNDINRERDYGRPGTGIDQLLGTLDRPINLEDARG